MRFRREHRHFFTIRELETKEALKQGDLQAAESILTESKKLDAGYPEQVKKYSKQLIEIYQQENRMEEYMKELLFQLLNCSQQDLTYFHELKKSFHGEPEEWRETVDQIVMSSKNDSFICEVLNEEKRYSELMEIIEKSGDVYWLNEYEKVLKKTFPDRVISVYVMYVLKEMELANSRKHYQHLVQYLKKMVRIENGKEEAENIARRWRMEYRRRSALMDELRKAGF